MSTLVTRSPEDTGEQPAPRQPADQSPKPSGIELVSEVSDLAFGIGLLIFVLAPLALPALALAAVAIVVLLIPMLAGTILAAPILLMRHLWKSREHTFAAEMRRDDQTSATPSARRCVRPEHKPRIGGAA